MADGRLATEDLVLRPGDTGEADTEQLLLALQSHRSSFQRLPSS